MNGNPTGGAVRVEDTHPAERDDVLRFDVVAEAPDCASVVVYQDRAPSLELRLDAGQRPAVAFGIGQVAWGAVG